MVKLKEKCEPCECHERVGNQMAGGCPNCCHCYPARACVSLSFPYDDAGPYCDCPEGDRVEVGLSQSSSQNPSANYAGLLTCGAVEIDFEISFEPVGPFSGPYGEPFFWDGECRVYLKSQCLGLTNDGDYDTRPSILLGGQYNDPAVARETCENLGLEFEVDLTGCADDCTGQAVIRIEPADYIVVTRRGLFVDADYQCCECEVDAYGHVEDIGCQCFHTRACVTFRDEYDEVVVDTCYDGYLGGWRAIRDPEEPYPFVVDILLVQPVEDNFILSLYTSGVSGEERIADCSPRLSTFKGRMHAEWLVGSTTVEIKADTKRHCLDCQCACRCLCVTYFDSRIDLRPRVGKVCWTEECSGGWLVEELGNPDEPSVPPVSFGIDVVCDPCELTSSLVLSIGNKRLASAAILQCPNIEGFWIIEGPDEEFGLDEFESIELSAECDRCTNCPAFPPFVWSCCDDENGDPIPLPGVVHATLSPADVPPCEEGLPADGSCDGIDGAVIVMYFDNDPMGGINGWLGSGFPYPGCPEKRLWLLLQCTKNPDGSPHFTITAWHFNPPGNDKIETGGVAVPYPSCQPFHAHFEQLGLSHSEHLELISGVSIAPCCQAPDCGTTTMRFDVDVTA